MSGGSGGATRQTIVVLDFGAQYGHLIARRVRENHVYSELLPFDVPVQRLRASRPQGIILSGGPESVYASRCGTPRRCSGTPRARSASG